MSISEALGNVAVSIAFVAVLFAAGAAVAAVIGDKERTKTKESGNENKVETDV